MSARGSPLFYVPLALAFSISVVWSGYRLLTSRAVGRITGFGLLRLLVAPVVLLVPMAYIAPGPEESLGRRACNFGPWGIAKGTVWFKVAPLPNGEAPIPREYTVDMVWGAARIEEYKATLVEPTYFAFNQRDWKSPGADITVTPPKALISCGFGNPPKGQPRRDLTGDDFKVGGSSQPVSAPVL